MMDDSSDAQMCSRTAAVMPTKVGREMRTPSRRDRLLRHLSASLSGLRPPLADPVQVQGDSKEGEAGGGAYCDFLRGKYSIDKYSVKN